MQLSGKLRFVKKFDMYIFQTFDMINYLVKFATNGMLYVCMYVSQLYCSTFYSCLLWNSRLYSLKYFSERTSALKSVSFGSSPYLRPSQRECRLGIEGHKKYYCNDFNGSIEV